MQFGLHFLAQGLIFGFSIALPIGPIGILCIRRTLQYGSLYGIVSGLGAAIADVVYGAFVAFGLTTISNFLVSYRVWLCLLGGLFLILMGLKIFVENPTKISTSIGRRTIIGYFLSTFFLTMTNPVTFITFINVFGGLEYGKTEGNYYFASLLVWGIFLGAMLWWLILNTGVSFFRRKISEKVMLGINRIAGVLIIVFGIYSIYST